jgi:hypothetical protein
LKQTEESQPEPTAETSGEMPAWLAQLRQSAESSAEPATGAPSEQADDTSGVLPPWMRAEPQAEEAAPTIPSWIEEAKSVEATEAPHVSEEEPQPEAASAVPSWVASLSHTEEITPASAETQPSEQELPPWFSQPMQPLAAPSEEPAPVQPETKPREEELPPWLRQPAQPTVATLFEAPVSAQSETEPREEELPLWLGQPTRPLEPAPVTPSSAPAKPPVAPKRKRPTRGDSHIILARTYRDANQMKEALVEYDFVVQKAPRLVHQVIGDLEVLSKRPDIPLEAHRILGDAYTRADRLAEALEEYRFVLEHVAS